MKKLSSCEILNYIYKVCSILIIRIDIINKVVENKSLNMILNMQKREYLNVINDCKDLLVKCKGIKENVSLIDRINNGVVNELKLMKDKNYVKNILVYDSKDLIINIDNKLKNYDYSNKNVDVFINKLRSMIIKNTKYIEKKVLK